MIAKFTLSICSMNHNRVGYHRNTIVYYHVNLHRMVQIEVNPLEYPIDNDDDDDDDMHSIF